MSKPAIAEEIRLRLAESLAVVERHRFAITSKMQAHLAALETEDEAFGQAEITGQVLVDLLVESAIELAACGALTEDRRIAAEHRRLDIDGRHYSRFGVSLVPVLREVLGPSLPPAIATAWCDAFWFVIRQYTAQETPRGAAAFTRAQLA